MRLAITFQRVDPSKGGAETYVADLLRRLVADGQEVALFANEWDASLLPREVEVVPVEAAGPTRSRRIWDFAKNSETALKTQPFDCVIGLINTWHQDILIPQGGVHAASLEANGRRFPPGWRRSLYSRSKTLNPKWWGLYRAIEREQYDPARQTRFVAVSRMVARDLQRFHAVPDERVSVIPNAIDPGRMLVTDRAAIRARIRARHGLADADLVGLFVAHNFRLKGLPPLLEAMAERIRLDPSRRAIHLFVCGGGKIAPMRRIVERLGLSGVIRLIGFAPSVSEYYHAADFFVLPSYYDPCSLVVFEALACGLPVITTTCNGAGEVLTEGREGFVVPGPDDAPAMIAALDAMTDDRRRLAMSSRAVELGRAQSFDRHVGRLLELCSDVASRKRVHRRDAQSPSRREEIRRINQRATKVES